MPIVKAQGKTISCESGSNLRAVLLKNEVKLYNSGIINCRGIGTCGTCAVMIEGVAGSVSEPNWKDKTRRSLPPHSSDRNLRLACQVEVLGDISVTKFDGFWGEGNTPVWTAEA